MEQNESGLGNRRFGAYLKRVRETRRLSLDAVEEMSRTYPERITKSHLSRIENGHATPTFPRLLALGQIYGVPITTLAERFEIELRRDLDPVDLRGKSATEALAEGDRLRTAGRYSEALAVYTSLAEGSFDGRGPSHAVDLELRRLHALYGVGAWEYAKSDAERLLNRDDLAPLERVRAFEIYVMACVRLGKYRVASLALQAARSDLDGVRPRAPKLEADLAMLEGIVTFHLGAHERAHERLVEAREAYESLSDVYNATMAQINVGQVLLEIDRVGEAEATLRSGIDRALEAGFEYLAALAMGHMAVLLYRKGAREDCRAYASRSSAIARRNDYPSLVFRNAFYLRHVAVDDGDLASARTHERTMRSYVHRTDEGLDEARAFRAELPEGEA